MKILGLMVALGTLATNAGALATTAGEERVKECVNDYSVAESQPEEVIRRYCSCMTQKMGASGTKSVLEWEVSNTDATTACEKESGWKYP